MRKTNRGVRQSGTRRRTSTRRRDSNAGGTVQHGPRAWAEIRARVLKRDGHTCQMQAHGCEGEASQVDHRVPQWAGGTDDESNLWSLCTCCHERKTQEDKHEYWLQRKAFEKEQQHLRHPGIKKPESKGGPSHTGTVSEPVRE